MTDDRLVLCRTNLEVLFAIEQCPEGRVPVEVIEQGVLRINKCALRAALKRKAEFGDKHSITIGYFTPEEMKGAVCYECYMADRNNNGAHL